MAKRIMRDFALFEISSVDRPCQAGALASIMKRAPCPECGGTNGEHKAGCSMAKAAASVCKECGGDGKHMEKCSMFDKSGAQIFSDAFEIAKKIALDPAKTGIASSTKKRSDGSGGVIVINLEKPSATMTNGALSVLFGKHDIELVGGDAVFATKSSASAFPIFGITKEALAALGVLAGPGSAASPTVGSTITIPSQMELVKGLGEAAKTANPVALIISKGASENAFDFTGITMGPHAQVVHSAQPSAFDLGDFVTAIDDAFHLANIAEKREFSSKERDRLAGTGAAMHDGSFPISNRGDLKNAIRAIGRAKNPAAARAHIKTRAKSLGLSDLIPDTWKVAPALEAFQPLLKMAAAYDAPALALAPIYAAIVKAAPDIDALPEGERTETLYRLMVKCVEKLAKIVPAASVDAFRAAIIVKGEIMDPKEVEKLQKRAAFLELLAKATDATKAFMAEQKMDEAAQAAFLAKTADEQKADIDKAAKAKKMPPKDDNDEDDMEKRLKKRDAEFAEVVKELGVLKAKDELTVCKELCRKAGVAEGKAEHLMKLRKLDPEIAEATLKEWSAAAKQANPNLFTELGKSGTGGDFASPYDELVAKAQELVAEMKKADPKTRITLEKAKAEVYTDPRFADLAKRIKTDEAQRRMGRAA